MPTSDDLPEPVGGAHLRTVTLPRDADASGDIAVAIEIWARDRTGEAPRKVTEGVFRYVTLDEDGKPAAVSD